MMQSPVFTVIIITYNRRDVLQRAIQSVLNQTFQSFEIIVIDNGSTDDTSLVVKNINDLRIKYVFNPDSAAVSYDSTRNIGIKMARANLISILDDDDIWYTTKLEKIKNIFDEYPDMSVVCHNIYKIVNGKIDKILRFAPPAGDNIYETLLYEKNCFSPSAVTIKTDLLRELNGFGLRKEFSGVLDYDLWLRMTAKSIKIYFVEEPLGEVVINGENWTDKDIKFQARVTSLIEGYLLEYEKKPILMISKRGMWRLLKLNYTAGRSFLRAGMYIHALKYYCLIMIFIIVKPSLVLNFFNMLLTMCDSLTKDNILRRGIK